jgi:nicotinate-nucleotide pyrophosphorylase (carboxylating)
MVRMTASPPIEIDELLRRLLAEDLGSGDVTSRAVVAPAERAEACLTAKADGVVAGVDLAGRIVRLLDPEATSHAHVADGAPVSRGDRLASIAGSARALLAAERTLLNLVQRMSGIATLTARFVAAVAGTVALILDTRKTAPGLRHFDKRAVAAGGGTNHRLGLSDQVLLKSNHFECADFGERRAIEAAVRAARASAPQGMVIAVEVLDSGEAVRAAAAGADVVLLDNMDPAQVAVAVAAVRARFRREQVAIEASGGVQLGNVRAYAEAGVDRISVGALTHSAPALDLALVFQRRGR